MKTPVVLLKTTVESSRLLSLNLNPVVLEVTVTVPVATVHVGCVKLAVGVAGPAGGAFITTVVPADIQPAAFLARMI